MISNATHRSEFNSPVCVIGAGVMGRGIALAAARSGLVTSLVDVDPDALERARQQVARGALPNDARLTFFEMTNLDIAVADAVAVIEAVPETVDIKQRLFGELGDLAAAAAVLATNTSTISITRIAERCSTPERVIGMHFFNPVDRMQLVELVVTDCSSRGTLQRALDLAAKLGKEAVTVADRPGFITSRLGLLLGTEAMRMVEEGVASAADIDRAIRLGYGHPMGPLELADLVGLDVRLNNLRSMFEQTSRAEYAPPSILCDLVAANRLGRKTGSGFYEYPAGER